MVNAIATVYVGDHYEVESATVRKYYTAGGPQVAMREDGELFWLLSNHLGSTALTVTEAGTLASELRYKAFGETRYAAGEIATSFRYTGQREEPDIGLYYYRARWYDPGLGELVQVSPSMPVAGGKQALDAFAYLDNNQRGPRHPRSNPDPESPLGLGRPTT